MILTVKKVIRVIKYSINARLKSCVNGTQYISQRRFNGFFLYNFTFLNRTHF